MNAMDYDIYFRLDYDILPLMEQKNKTGFALFEACFDYLLFYKYLGAESRDIEV